ncbi:MAG: DUF4367 domain-containing protein [Defluviitaleaceae bacterium]|nr:DUF4367 domain-containing protein [Defluviitaleaceae bacterium]MCL2263339.1 DUF4367 domain-containing protein [Defluviitaleaceae bacterium]
MKNSANDGLNEKIFDALFKIAADEALKEEMDAMPSCEELNKLYPRTKSLDKKVYAVINRESRAIKTKKAIRAFTKIAAGFCVIAVLGIGAAMSVEASRNFILNFFVDMRGDYVAFDFGLGDRPTPGDGKIVLGYKPEGFELVSNHAMESMTMYVFADDSDNQIIIQRLMGSDFFMGVDYEYMVFSEIQILGASANLFTSIYDYGTNKVMWAIENGVITITTTLDTETLIRIAENIIVG